MDQIRSAFNGMVSVCYLIKMQLEFKYMTSFQCIITWCQWQCFYFLFYFIFSLCAYLSVRRISSYSPTGFENLYLVQMRGERYSRFTLHPVENGEQHAEVNLSDDTTDDATEMEMHGSPSFKPALRQSRRYVVFAILGVLLIFVLGEFHFILILMRHFHNCQCCKNYMFLTVECFI